MTIARDVLTASQTVRQRPAGSIARRFLTYCLFLVFALIALAAHEHFRLQGQRTPALASLLVAGGFALAPLRAVLGGVFRVGGAALHFMHGLGAIAFAGLSLGGLFSGAPLVRQAAYGPFAIMGAAQAIMHQNHPRNAAQAAALRSFATSLPEVEQFTHGDLTSPANAARAVSVLTDLVSKAQVLGQTELQADPGFQGALRQVTTRFGLTLGLDTIDHAIEQLSSNPAAASAIPGLRSKLAAARSAAAGGG